ncbi:MAG: hypothetical protein H7A24_07140 [Leptospiraceae bacterium]|nr:hypothetical protein [Leptospiraceae bacterium]MCP5511639.1 hypothetical protein [Leptospiraceae bacterium]
MGFPDLQKHIFGFLKIINPFQVLIEAVEETRENYRVEVDMRYLNELIHLEILDKAESLLALDVFAEEGKIQVTGEYFVGDYLLARIFRVRTVLFSVHLIPIWVKSNHVRFQITHYRLKNKEKMKFDPVEIFSRFDPYHKNYILNILVSLYPKILSLTKLKYEIRLNLNYYLQKADLSSDSVKVSRIESHMNTLVLHLRSSVVLRPLVDIFGSNVISVKESTTPKKQTGQKK